MSSTNNELPKKSVLSTTQSLFSVSESQNQPMHFLRKILVINCTYFLWVFCCSRRYRNLICTTLNSYTRSSQCNFVQTPWKNSVVFKGNRSENIERNFSQLTTFQYHCEVRDSDIYMYKDGDFSPLMTFQ